MSQQTVTAKITSTIQSVVLSLGCAYAAVYSLNAHAQEFYKWVDSSGTTHYTTTPPPKAKGVKQQGKINTFGLKNSPSSNPTPPVTTMPSSMPNTTPNNTPNNIPSSAPNDPASAPAAQPQTSITNPTAAIPNSLTPASSSAAKLKTL